jgi:hypothetical protein
MTQPPEDTTADPADTRDRQPTLLEQMGGVSGLVYSSVPILVFVLVNSIFSLQPAIWSAVGVALVIMAMQIVRRKPLQPAISGFFGVAIAAFIANWTGSAKGFFLFGIWASLIYGSLFALSVLIRWPLAGVVWNALNGNSMAWRSDRKAMFSYDVATAAWALVFFARFIVQHWLYDQNQTGWLAFARIAMGYPLTALAAAVTVWAVTRAGHRVRQLEQAAEDSDEEIEARLRAKYSGDQAATESA